MDPKIMSEKLTALEERVLYLLRNLKPFERIEIKCDKQREISVTMQSTVKETFPID